MKLDNKAVVLVDDNDITNYYNKDLVQESGIFDTIKVLTNGDDCINYLKETIQMKGDLPALFLIDVKMPDMDGFELIDTIDEMFDEDEVELAPVFVILTTSDHKRDYEQFDKTPIAKKFITKPLNNEKFIAILKEFEFM